VNDIELTILEIPMTDKNKLSRRTSFKIGIGAVGAAASAPAVASMCGFGTGEQPLGPFFPNAGTPTRVIREDQNPNTPLHLANDADLTFVQGRSGTANGQFVYVMGRLTDDDCNPIANATIVVWQASDSGKYNHNGDGANSTFRHPKTGVLIRRKLDSNFQFWGKIQTNDEGNYVFKTIIPGFYPANLDSGWFRPPHIHFMVTAIGLPQFVTQMYFKGEIQNSDFIEELNRADPLLQSRSISKEQREKLIVNFNVDPTGQFNDGLVGEFDIQMPSR
jgi:protocatechuate 3,4-dioxygenase, beta subunit